MHRGYINLWRKSLDSGIFKDHTLWTFWSWCLLKSTWKKRQVIFNMQVVDLEPGQFIFGRKVASYELGISEQKVRTCLKKIEKMGNITIKATNRYSIISIMNWGTYQQDQPTANQPHNQQLTSRQPTVNQQLTTNNKDKPVKKDKEQKEAFLKYSYKKTKESNLSEYNEKIKEFITYRMKKQKAKQYKSEKGIDGLFRNLVECKNRGYDVVACIDISIERDWLSPDPSYFEKNPPLLNVEKPQRNIEDMFQDAI